MIKLEHVSKSYSAGIPALNDVSLNIEEGEFVFIVGDSGSGKSTLIKLLLKELEPTEGTITINGQKLNKIRRRQIPKFRRKIGVVFQDFRLLKDRNIYDNVAFAQKVIGESTRSIKKNVPLMLSMVGLAAKYRSYPKQLSGGEQQRVAIARALINKPKILLADEPTGNLDNNNAWEIMKLMEEINNNGTTVVVVTHNLEIVKAMNKRVITMQKGVIVDDSDTASSIVTGDNAISRSLTERDVLKREGDLSVTVRKVATTMRINTFFYSIRQGLKNIFRNKMFSLASIATMTACIFLFGLFYSIVTNFQAMVKDAESGVAVTVFFDAGISEQRIEEIGDLIKQRVEVSHCEYTSADEAWESFKDVYFDGNEDAASSFAGDNPLANSASYSIYMNDISMQSTLVTYLESIDGIRSVKQSEMVAHTLTDFNSLIGYISAGIILILLGVAVFLISNTITVGISVRREEIGIMKLIGATDYFVRAPFVVEGIVIGLIGAAIPLGILYVLYEKIILYIGDKFKFISNMIQFLSVDQVFHTLVPVALLLGVGIGFIGSRITIRKHLKV